MALITTGFEPSGGNWRLIAEKVYDQAAPGTAIVASYMGFGGPYILGWDLFGAASIDDVHSTASKNGLWVYYISLWRDQPSFVGFDSYRAIFLHRA